MSEHHLEKMVHVCSDGGELGGKDGEIGKEDQESGNNWRQSVTESEGEIKRAAGHQPPSKPVSPANLYRRLCYTH